MIYNKPLLTLTILFESLRKKPIFGVYRPQAYIKESRSYCTNLRLDQFKKEILFGEQIVLPVVLESPVGYGKHLKAGALLTIKDGLDLVGKAIVLEINGYTPY
jgi:translation elongation factor EF-Tu-like GTPase